jgi:hypothetical protein
VVVLTGKAKGLPDHAMAGCWAGPIPGERPLVFDRDTILEEIEAENLLLVESTGVAHGAGQRLQFQDGLTRAKRHVEEVEWICLVDVKALRPPLGLIFPMDSPQEPEVGCALDEARNFARSKQRELVETVHLFYGILQTGGAVVDRLVRDVGFDREDLCRRIAEMVKPRSFPGDPMLSKNCRECQLHAEDIAWHARAPTVREQDLLWAIMKRGGSSRALMKIINASGLDWNVLAEHLQTRYPYPIDENSSFTCTRSER